MSEPTPPEPLDLRSLAEVESPDVVRAALATFRRRLITRYVWVTIMVAVIVGAAFWGLQPSTLEERIQRAEVAAEPGTVWHLEGGSVGLARVVQLRDGVGLRLVMIPASGDQQGSRIEVAGALGSEYPGDGFDAFVEVPPSSDGRYQASFDGSSGKPQSFTIDLRSMHVPSSVWKEPS
jgi:hypothetical protein